MTEISQEDLENAMVHAMAGISGSLPDMDESANIQIRFEDGEAEIKYEESTGYQTSTQTRLRKIKEKLRDKVRKLKRKRNREKLETSDTVAGPELAKHI